MAGLLTGKVGVVNSQIATYLSPEHPIVSTIRTGFFFSHCAGTSYLARAVHPRNQFPLSTHHALNVSVHSDHYDFCGL